MYNQNRILTVAALSHVSFFHFACQGKIIAWRFTGQPRVGILVPGKHVDVLALAWAVMISSLALVSVLMMLVCVPAGSVLLLLHQMVIADKSFARVRSHGLGGAFRRSLVVALRRGTSRPWQWPRRRWGLVAVLVLVPLVGFLAGGVIPVVFAELFLSPTNVSSSFGSAILSAAGLGGTAGVVTVTYVWVRGLGFVARPSAKQRGLLQPLVFPPGLSQEFRDHLALNSYWRSQLNTARIFSIVYPWWFLAVFMSGVPDGAANVSPDSYQGASMAVDLAQLLILVAPTAIPVLIASRPVERRLAAAKVCEHLCVVLNPSQQNGSSAHDQSGFPWLISDPLGGLRKSVGQVAIDLDDTASQMDRQQQRGLPAHPVATLLRAVAQSIREYLGSERSLQEGLPDDLSELLETTLAIFGAHPDQSVYSRLAQQVSAFDADGNPAAEVIQKLPGRLARLAGQAVAGIPKMTLIVTSITTLVGIALAVVLAVRHQMAIAQLLQYLR